jgi:hypothetical protein
MVSCKNGTPVSNDPPDEGTDPLPDPFVPAEHPIGIRTVDGEAQFFSRETGEQFVPRGMNYFYIVSRPGGGFEDRFFGVSEFDPVRVRADFEEVAEKGYNVVRIFLDTCSSGTGCIGRDEGGLNEAYLRNIKRTMEIAAETGIQLILTSNDLPSQGGYVQIADEAISSQFAPYRNVQFLSDKGVEAFRLYWDDLLRGLTEIDAPLETVMAWSLLNEQWYFRNEPPFSLSSGSVQTANGRSYNMASEADKKRMAVDGMVYFIDSIREVIDQYDPNALVTMGFFWPDYPNPLRQGDFRYVETQPLLFEADLDFFDFHAYSEAGPIEQIAENFGMTGYSDKPVIMGEYGVFVHQIDELDVAVETTVEWMAQSCRQGFDGWLYWGLYRAPIAIGDASWSFKDGEGEMMNALSPVEMPDPCDESLLPPENIAAGKDVSASRSLAEGPPSHAVDGDGNTSWQSGSGAPQWIEIDLGELYDIDEVRLFVDQFPEGNTTHRVLGKEEAEDPFRELHVFSGFTEFGDRLRHSFDEPVQNIRYIRIQTVESPSWISWSEIEVFAKQSFARL